MESHTWSRVSLLSLEKARLCERDLSLGGVFLLPLSMLSLKKRLQDINSFYGPRDRHGFSHTASASITG